MYTINIIGVCIHVHLKGYKHCGMFLATQAPLEETVEDFWRMVWENKSHTIAMLCLTEEGEEECDRKQVHMCQNQSFQIMYLSIFKTSL